MRSRAAIRYSKAIFQIAKESNNLPNIKDDMDSIISAHESSEDFKKLINNTLINYSDRKEILSTPLPPRQAGHFMRRKLFLFCIR